ncbi:hypothetical protein GS918_28055, partial [Rhodococcus hoagii]|nr:hypothetical protein [Prescottella equi]
RRSSSPPGLAAAADGIWVRLEDSSTSTTKATSAARRPPDDVTEATHDHEHDRDDQYRSHHNDVHHGCDHDDSRDESEPALIEQGGVGIANSNSNS